MLQPLIVLAVTLTNPETLNPRRHIGFGSVGFRSPDCVKQQKQVFLSLVTQSSQNPTTVPARDQRIPEHKNARKPLATALTGL